MARRAEPRVIDFRKVFTPRELEQQFQAYVKWREGLVVRVYFNTLDPFEGEGSQAHTRPVPAYRMKRARRILWKCMQQPEWERTHAAFYKHPSLRNVPYPVLRKLVKESEARDA